MWFCGIVFIHGAKQLCCILCFKLIRRPLSDIDNDIIPYTVKHLQSRFMYSYYLILGGN